MCSSLSYTKVQFTTIFVFNFVRLLLKLLWYFNIFVLKKRGRKIVRKFVLFNLFILRCFRDKMRMSYRGRLNSEMRTILRRNDDIRDLIIASYSARTVLRIFCYIMREKTFFILFSQIFQTTIRYYILKKFTIVALPPDNIKKL